MYSYRRENHPRVFALGHGGRRAVVGIEEVSTSVNTLVVWNIGVE